MGVNLAAGVWSVAFESVNSMWQLQARPFAGDVVNSYNDGPPQSSAAQLGRFYELESSSPALALRPGESATHEHRTLHLEGSDADLEAIARAALGTGLAEIQGAFKPGEPPGVSQNSPPGSASGPVHRPAATALLLLGDPAEMPPAVPRCPPSELILGW